MKSESEGRKGNLFDTPEICRRQAQFLFGALAIIFLLFLVYLPILPGNFLMDDARLVGGDNPLVNGELTPRTLWFQTDFTLATFGWWLEKLAFGENPCGYHVVNICLQAFSSILLWRLLARLKIPGAWLAAAIFAVHPVCVASVARVAELKNTLAMPFYLLCFVGYLHYEAGALYPQNPCGPGKWRRCATIWLTISLVAFVLALLAKTTTVMLPVVLLICAAWQRGKISGKDLLHTAPFFLLALAFGLMTIWFQKHQALPSTHQVLTPETIWQRLAASGTDFWFYFGKSILPVHLSVVYFRPEIDAAGVSGFVPLALVITIFLLCWRFRRRWGRHALFGLGTFAVTLFPALGFFDAQYQTMWRVSDHLQYKPLVAVIALEAAVLAILLRKDFFRSAASGLLLAFCLLAFQRAEVFRTEESLVRDTLKKNPQAWAAHNDLGVILGQQNDLEGAVREFMLSLEFNSQNLDAYQNLGYALTAQKKFGEAERELRSGLKIDPAAGQLHRALAEALKQQGREREAFRELEIAASLSRDPAARMELASWLYAGHATRPAVEQLRHALALEPDNAEALNNLAWILATSSDDSLRNGNEAVDLAKKSCRLTFFRRPEMVSALAAAYAEDKKFPQAVAAAELAIKMADATGNFPIAATDRQLLEFYRAGRPYHGP